MQYDNNDQNPALNMHITEYCAVSHPNIHHARRAALKPEKTMLVFTAVFCDLLHHYRR